jgi:hypothetical protein
VSERRIFSSEGCADAMVAAGHAAEQSAPSEGARFTCGANRTADPPEDCGWPTCGCDPYASEVLTALEESGYELLEFKRITDIMVGGDHLANVLISKLGPNFAEKVPSDLDAESALRILCATPEYDVWCCWAAIMRARDGSPTTKVPAESPSP